MGRLKRPIGYTRTVANKRSLEQAETRAEVLMQLRLGSTLAEAMRALRISKSSGHRWISEHPAFQDEIDLARGEPAGTMRARRVGQPKLIPAVVEAEVIELPARATREADEDGLDFDPDCHYSLARRFARDYVTASSDGLKGRLATILMGRAMVLAQARQTDAVVEVEVEVGPEQPPQEIAEGDWRGS